MKSLLRTYAFIVNHPLGGRHKLRALTRWLKWQIACRLGKSPIVVPFIGDTRLAVSRGMHGATGNIYCGLHEFNDMAFVLHFLWPEDHFVDIGANVGSYTILASGVCGAITTAVEPVSSTAAALQRNVHINHLGEKVKIYVAAVGEESGKTRISSAEDCTNHILKPGETVTSEEVSQTTLDELLEGRHPILIKIDVEGFEMKVLRGGKKTFSDPHLKAVIMEVNGSGLKYGIADDDLLAEMEQYGFTPHSYLPEERTLLTATEAVKHGGNWVFLRNTEGVHLRLKGAKPFSVMGDSF